LVEFELIDCKKWSPGPEVAVYRGLTDQFNVSNGSISNVKKFFIASGGVIYRFTKKKLQIATPKQDKLLVWISKKASHSDPVKLKTDLQTKKVQYYHRLKKVTGFICLWPGEKILDTEEKPDRSTWGN
jgi:hypothetical protein